MTLAHLSAALALVGCLGAFELANPGFEEVRDGLPASWQPYAWDRPQDVRPGLAGEAAEGERCLRLPAVDPGAAGVISPPLAISGEAVALRVRLRLRPSADYAGNQAWIFLSCHQGGRYLAAATVPLPSLTNGAWTTIDAAVPAERIPAGTDTLHLNLASRRIGDGAATGCLDVDAVAISEDLDAVAVTIACDRFASWTVVGQPATFTIGAGRLPGRASAVTVEIRDSAERVLRTESVPAAAFAASGWTWTPTVPGYYEIAFTAQVDREGRPVAIPLTGSYRIRTQKKRDIDFSRARWSLAVAAAPTRPMAERPAHFGFSYQLGGEDDIRLAEVLGLAFARIHAIPWGAQFSDPKRAIEPERGVYRWEELDRKVGWLHSRGFAMVGNVMYTPQWASPHPEDTKVDICVPGFAAWAPKDLGDWTRFLTALIGRYGDRIRIWELWNEPHLPGGSCFWHDTPENFVALLKAGYQAVKAAQPDSEVWIGGIGMRYVPFYRYIARLGALPFFDRLALHGSGCDPQPFEAIDRASAAPSKPWVTSEQHGILLNPGNEIPSERALAKRLVLDSFGQLALGAERLALFQLPESWEKEQLEAARAEGWFIHSSGVFRTRPRLEPRLPALVWHTVISQVRPGMRVRSQHRLGEVRVLACDNAGTDLLLVWHEGADPLAVPAELAALGSVIDWEGREVTAPWASLEPGVMYLVRSAAAATVAALPAGQALPPPRSAKTVAGPVPTATATWGKLPADAALVPATTWIDGATATDVAAGFALAADAGGIEIRVDVRDPDHHPDSEPGKFWRGDSVQIGLDTGGSGIGGDQVTFCATLTSDGPVVWKHAAPYIGGDLPSGWTPANRPAAYASATITPVDGGMRYVIRIPTSELYPLIPDREQPLRFSLLVNSNRGQGRAGWVEWGSGIGKEANPAAYGILTWR